MLWLSIGFGRYCIRGEGDLFLKCILCVGSKSRGLIGAPSWIPSRPHSILFQSHQSFQAPATEQFQSSLLAFGIFQSVPL